MRVFVALDFSPACFAALRRAHAIAGAKGSLRLFHSIAGPVDESTVGPLSDRARRLLEDRAQDLRNDGFRNIETEVSVGRPADQILAAVEGAKPDLVVLAARTRSTASRVFLGTVSEEVVRRSPIPVLVVREQQPELTADRVLVAIDREAASHEAAKVGLGVACALGVPAEGLHVIELPTPPAWVGPFPNMLHDLTPELVRESRRTVEEGLAAALGEDKLPVRFVSGSPESELLRHARPSDILVCGTHGRGVLGRIAFGSVATRLLREAPCPVLVVRPQASEESGTGTPASTSASTRRS